MTTILPSSDRWASFGSRVYIRAVVRIGIVLRSCRPNQTRRFLTLAAKGLPEASHQQATQARDLVLKYDPRTRGETACVPRVIASALLCRRRYKSWPRVCFGVLITPPFRAHAWLEAEGRSVQEDLPATFYGLLFAIPAGREP